MPVYRQVFANSHDVAAYFAKRHDAVLRDIRDLIDKEPDLRLHNFVETVIDRPNPSGGASIQSKAYDMDRRGFTVLAIGLALADRMPICENGYTKWGWQGCVTASESTAMRFAVASTTS